MSKIFMRKISDNTLECVLTPEFISMHGITSNSLMDGSYDRMDDLFTFIIKEAQSELNFEPHLSNNIHITYSVAETEDHCILLVLLFRSKEEIEETDVLQQLQECLEEISSDYPLVAIYFEDLSDVIRSSKLMKDIKLDTYLVKFDYGYELILQKPDDMEYEEFDNICSSFSEFGEMYGLNDGYIELNEEHDNVLLTKNAVTQLAKI